MTLGNIDCCHIPAGCPQNHTRSTTAWLKIATEKEFDMNLTEINKSLNH